MMMWLNTGLIDDALPSLSSWDRGLTLGDGVFETLAVREGRILRLAAHLERLKQGCFVLGLPYPELDMVTALEAVLIANHLSDAVLRLTVTRGVAPRGLLPPAKPNPTLMVTAAPMPSAREPADCLITTVTRRNEHSPLCRIKALPYLDNILALQDAVARGANEALLLNSVGRVVTASSANIFVISGGRILTPPVVDGALPGIARATLMHAMAGIVERSLFPEDLYQAEEILLTNSLGVRPVATLNGRSVGQKTTSSRLLDFQETLDA